MNLKVGDQAWIAAAILHRAQPDRQDFSLQEINRKAATEFAGGDPDGLQPGVWQHIVSHGVAQNPPTPNRARLFTLTDKGRRRLYRPDDKCDPRRLTGKTHPDRHSVPEKYWELIDWYEHNYLGGERTAAKPRGDSRPSAFTAFVGLIPAYDLNLMKTRIEQDCERIEDEDAR